MAAAARRACPAIDSLTRLPVWAAFAALMNGEIVNERQSASIEQALAVVNRPARREHEESSVKLRWTTTQQYATEKEGIRTPCCTSIRCNRKHVALQSFSVAQPGQHVHIGSAAQVCSAAHCTALGPSLRCPAGGSCSTGRDRCRHPRRRPATWLAAGLHRNATAHRRALV